MSVETLASQARALAARVHDAADKLELEEYDGELPAIEVTEAGKRALADAIERNVSLEDEKSSN